MWTRQELKAKGKAAFKRNYWKSVAAGLVVLLTTGVTVSSGAGSTGYTEFEVDLDAGLAQSGISPAVFVGVLFGVLGVACLLSMAINAFLRNPIQVGTNRFFLKNLRSLPSWTLCCTPSGAAITSKSWGQSFWPGCSSPCGAFCWWFPA